MLIHVSRDGQQFGPYTPEDVQAYLADGSLLTTDLGWVEGAADWVPLPQLVSGSAAPPPAVSGAVCPRCGVGLEADQVVCLACGHNLDEPMGEVLSEEPAPQEKRKVPPSLSYEDELADRASFVNSVGWGLMMAAFLPVFGDGQWNVPMWKFWELEAWQSIFGIVAPAILGVGLIVMASSMHGRNRGVVVLLLTIVLYSVYFIEPSLMDFSVPSPVEDTTEKIPEPLTDDERSGERKIPEKIINLTDQNSFFIKLNFSPDRYLMTIVLFVSGWMMMVIGTKARFYRTDSIMAYIISMVGSLLIIASWVVPNDLGMPIMAAIEALSENLFMAVGLLVMFGMHFSSALLCFINTRGKKPSLMKKYSSLATVLIVTSISAPVLPMWGKVILEECKNDKDRAQKRLDYVDSQFGTIYTGTQATQKDMALNKVEKPMNAVIGAVCGWVMVGVKYVGWIGGVMILLPLGVVEIIAGTRERDENFMTLQQ